LGSRTLLACFIDYYAKLLSSSDAEQLKVYFLHVQKFLVAPRHTMGQLFKAQDIDPKALTFDEVEFYASLTNAPTCARADWEEALGKLQLKKLYESIPDGMGQCFGWFDPENEKTS
jgi:hypothetical protein